MKENDVLGLLGEAQTEAEADLGFPASLELDPAKYRAELAGLELTEEQETELLETLWSIMGSFARMGFSVDVCGLIFEEFNRASTDESGGGKMSASTNMETLSDSTKGGNA